MRRYPFSQKPICHSLPPFTGAQSLRDPFNRNIFNIRASYFDETEYLVDRLLNIGLKNIAVFYQNDACGKAGLAGVERALKKRNLTILETATVERKSTDVAAAVAKLLPKNRMPSFKLALILHARGVRQGNAQGSVLRTVFQCFIRR